MKIIRALFWLVSGLQDELIKITEKLGEKIKRTAEWFIEAN